MNLQITVYVVNGSYVHRKVFEQIMRKPIPSWSVGATVPNLAIQCTASYLSHPLLAINISVKQDYSILWWYQNKIHTTTILQLRSCLDINNYTAAVLICLKYINCCNNTSNWLHALLHPSLPFNSEFPASAKHHSHPIHTIQSTPTIPNHETQFIFMPLPSISTKLYQTTNTSPTTPNTLSTHPIFSKALKPK